MLGLCQPSNYLTLKGSYSAVSKPDFTSKYALEALAEIYTMHSFAPFSKLNVLFEIRFKNVKIVKLSLEFVDLYADFSEFHEIL